MRWSLVVGLLQASSTSAFLSPGYVWDVSSVHAPFAFPAFFAAVRLVALGLVVVGVAASARIPSTMES